MYKIAGALAYRGGSLDEVYQIAEWTSQHIATIGVSLGHVHVSLSPPHSYFTFSLAFVD